MAGGNGRQDAAADDLVGDLTLAPLADGATGNAGRFTGQRHDLADLLGGNLGRAAGARGIGQALLDAQVGQVDPLEGQPALAPQPDGIDIEPQVASNLAIN